MPQSEELIQAASRIEDLREELRKLLQQAGVKNPMAPILVQDALHLVAQVLRTEAKSPKPV